MGKEVHDIVIIGAGIMGTSLAYFLARAGQDVCVVDKGVVGGEGTGRSAGWVRQSRRPPAELSLTMRSIQLWKMLAEESDLDFEYRQHGNLGLAWNEKDVADKMAMVERQRAAGLECYFLDRDETRALIPAVTDAYLGGDYCPADGSAEPYLANVALSRAATRLGATIHEHREVTGIQVVDGKVSAVLTASGAIATGVVVNAAGAWAPVIGRMVGLRIPATVCRSHLLVTERLPPFLEPLVDAGSYGYFRQALSGNLLIGYSSLPVPNYNRRVTYEAVTVAARRMSTLIPLLRGASVIRSFTGFTVWTPDFLPIVGPVKQPRGFFMAAEFSGTGLAMGPVCGELMAELMLHGRTSLPIDAFSPERFDLYSEEGSN